MNFGFNPNQNNLIVSFTDKEKDWCLQLIEIAIEEESERGARLPSPDQLRLRRSNELPNDYYLDFSFEHLSLGMAFLRNIYERRVGPNDSEKMEEILFKIHVLCGDDTVYH
ncbi:MAG: hypothetical protein Q7K40_04695 [bacterium]|nr:hypothetical protein [bacterium]